VDINLIFDASTTAAPSGFFTAIEYAAQQIDNLILNNITVNIQVGWGEDNGTPVSGGDLGLGGPIQADSLTYTQLVNELDANMSSAADGSALANLPTTNPTSDTVEVYGAQEKAWGLLPANGTEIDGAVGFNSSYGSYNFSTTDWSTGFDFVGIAEHELTHALGRISPEQFSSGYVSTLDLFRFVAPGTLAMGSEPAYFSIDGGTTDLKGFNNTDDYADWSGSSPDSFDETGPFGVENPITPTDDTLLSVLGFDVPANPGTVTSFVVSSETALNIALADVRFGEIDANYTITLAPGLPGGTLALEKPLSAIELPVGCALVIDGGGQTIDGGGSEGGFIVTTGNVTLQNLTIAHTVETGGAGGSNASGGGGGAGEGGGVFVGAGATVTLNNVIFNADAAVGGAGGFALGGSYYTGDGGTLNNTGPIVANGSQNSTQTAGGPGGEGQGGGGGGNWMLNPPYGPGGAGGFGGGGGGGGVANGVAAGGVGGFGGGNGGAGNYAGGGGGGGGLGAGGDAFVSSGGLLVIEAGALSGGSVTGGTGGGGTGASPFEGSPGDSGAAFGAGIFIRSNGTIDLSPLAGQTLTVSDPIADQTGSGGTGINAGAGAVVASGGGLVKLDAASTYTGGTFLQHGVTLDLGATGGAGTGTIQFAGLATLRIESGVSVANTITGLASGDILDLAGITNAGSAGIVSYNAISHQLTIEGGGTSAVLQLDPAATFDVSNFLPALDAAGTGTSVAEVACFAQGTRILTCDGELAVEELLVGDLVVSASRKLAPIVWLGHWTVACAPRHAWPVRIAAGAFGSGQPKRDLFLSPDHAVFVNGVLIPIRYLINDTSIAQIKLDEITYYHVELPRHDVILAEGLPVESYLGDRTDFGAMRLLGGRQAHETMWAAFGCAPLVVCGPELEAVRQQLAGITRQTRAGPPSMFRAPALPGRVRRTACSAPSQATRPQ